MAQALRLSASPIVLVTGASGFVGSALVASFVGAGMSVRAAARQANTFPPGVEPVSGADLNSTFDWRAALRGCDAIVHAAARVHLMRDSALDPLGEFRRVNVSGTLRLAQQAAEVGVRRLVFLSSIKVNGESTAPGRPFTADDKPAPTDPYGISKYEAEQGLLALARQTAMEVVIIRPVLVYGPGVKANFLSLMKWLHRGIPLPLGRTRNYRSLVAMDNLIDLVHTCLQHPAAARQIFLASDGEDLSTTNLLCRLSYALGKPARLFSVPTTVLKAGAVLLGQREMAQRLLASLQVDVSKARHLLNWVPPITVDEGLRRAARGFLQARTAAR